jgi:uridine phosphorylase
MLMDNISNFQFGNYRITNFDMETSALYGLGKSLGHRCLSLGTIVANRISREISANSERALEQLINKSLEIISASNL